MTTVTGAERHASWLELFFDLVAVAGIGMLAHLLVEDSSRSGLAVYVIASAAISQPHSDVSDHTTWILLTAYAGYAVLSAGILLACGERAAAARAGLALGAASVAVAVLDLRSEAVVWVLAAGVLVAVQQRARDEASSARNT